MAKHLGIYKCEICGNVVEVVHAAGGKLVCCGEPMVHLFENTTDAAKEKHVPVLEVVDGGVRVSVGSVIHPMDEKHYIEWIELIVDNKAYREFLKPGDTPVVFFPVTGSAMTAREHCNLHGVWAASN